MYRKKEWTAILFSFPALAIAFLILVVPVFYSLGLSFYNWDMVRPNSARTFIGLDNYVELFTQDTQFPRVLQNTILFLIAIVTVEFLLGFAEALLIFHSRIGRGFIVLFLLPAMIAPSVAAASFDFLLNESLGPVNWIIESLGFSAVPWLSDNTVAFITIVIVDAWQWTPYMMMVLLAGLQGISPELFEAASVDGASAFRTFTRVTLPLMRPIILMAILLRSVGITKLFEPITLLTYGGPGNSTTNAAFYAYLNGFRFFRIGYAAAIGMVMLAIFSVLIVAFYKIMKQEGQA